MDADANKVRSGPHSMVSGSGSVFNCAFRLFKASLDGFGAPPEGVLGVWCGGGNEGGRRGNAGVDRARASGELERGGGVDHLGKLSDGTCFLSVDSGLNSLVSLRRTTCLN